MSEILHNFPYPGCAKCVVPKVVARETGGQTNVTSPVCVRCRGQNPPKGVEIIFVGQNRVPVVTETESSIDREE